MATHGRPRYAGWVRARPDPLSVAADADPLSRVFCPTGHHVARRRLIGLGEKTILECGYRPQQGAPPCTARMLVVKLLRPVAEDNGRLSWCVYIAEVEEREARYLANAHELVDVFAALSWLGCGYAPSEDVSRRAAG